MLILHLETIEIDKIYQHCLVIKIPNLTKKLMNLGSISINRNPNSENELANKEKFDD